MFKRILRLFKPYNTPTVSASEYSRIMNKGKSTLSMSEGVTLVLNKEVIRDEYSRYKW